MGQAAENICHIELLIEINRDIIEVHRRLSENERQRYENECERQCLVGMLDSLHKQKRDVVMGRFPPVVRLSAAASNSSDVSGVRPA